uniref:C-type lectin domain family 4 member M-like n=1 Tax=Mastacembelus armatus TaxID=205130 RepID=A0A3Q3MNG6_9TELE
MEIDDNIDNYFLSFDSVDFQQQKRPSRRATVCLFLLCAVLLAGNIAQIIYCIYNTLKKEKEQLQTKHNNLQREKEELQTRMHCQTDWRKLDTSCYFLSTTKKNWTESRKDCIARGGDLVVIDSWDEQVFLNGLLQTHQNAWIGLSDALNEGTWTWVDKTPVTTTYWQVGQPNNFSGGQDCGEIVRKSSATQTWNDDGCFAQQTWICEN